MTIVISITRDALERMRVCAAHGVQQMMDGVGLSLRYQQAV